MRTYYHDGLKPIGFDPAKAKNYLKNSGWADTDNNGILDKVLEGKKTELTFNILIPGNELFKNPGTDASAKLQGSRHSH